MVGGEASMNVLVFASRKGGAGKSTLAAHLAVHASRPSRPTLLVDCDPQGSVSAWHELRGRKDPALRFCTRGIAQILNEAKREGFEWAFIDTPPDTSAIIWEAILMATLVVIPARPSFFDVIAVQNTIDVARELQKPYAVVLNAAPARRSDAEAPITARMREYLKRLNVPVWSGQITNRGALALALMGGEGAKEFDATSSASAEIAQLWGAIYRSVEAINGAYENARAIHGTAA
jgi:chromosome partitioning protein